MSLGSGSLPTSSRPRGLHWTSVIPRLGSLRRGCAPSVLVMPRSRCPAARGCLAFPHTSGRVYEVPLAAELLLSLSRDVAWLLVVFVVVERRALVGHLR